MKKIISILTLFLILISITSNSVFALSLQKNKTIIGGVGKTFTTSDFLQKRPDIGSGVFQVNFKGISKTGVKGTFKAGSVLKSFKRKINFPKTLVLPEGISYELNTNNLDSEFIRTSSITSKISRLKRSGVDIGNIKVTSPELRILPDRLQYIKKTVISYNTKAEFDNIKKYLSEEFNLGQDGVTELTNKLNIASLNIPIEQPNLQTIVHKNNLLTNRYIKKDSSYNRDLSLLKQKLNSIKSKIRTPRNGEISSLLDVDDSKLMDDAKGLECKNDIKCTKLGYNDFTKYIISTEKIEKSLIPTTISDIEKTGKSLLELDPKDIRLSMGDINNRFKLVKEINSEKKLPGADYLNVDGVDLDSISENVYLEDDYCAVFHDGFTGSLVEKNKLIADCNIAKASMQKKTPQFTQKGLLNGFTKGDSDRYGFDVDIYIDFTPRNSGPGTKVLEFGLSLYYGYAVGIRIPLKLEGYISDNQLTGYSSGGVELGEYQNTLKIDTIDASEEFYKDIFVSDEENEDSYGDRVYEGNEIVVKFTSSLNIHLRVYSMDNDLDIEIPLVSVLLIALSAAAELSGDGVQDVLKAVGISNANLLQLFMSFYFKNAKQALDDSLSEDSVKTLNKYIGYAQKGIKYGKPALDYYYSLKKNGELDTKKKAKLDKIFHKLNDLFDGWKDQNNLLITRAAGHSGDFVSGAWVDTWRNYSRDAYQQSAKLLASFMGEYDDAIKEVGENKYLDAIAGVFQMLLMNDFIENNMIDLSRNLKPPFGNEYLELYKYIFPEIPLYTAGIFKLAAKIGGGVGFGGRITAKCNEKNTIGGCPDKFVKIAKTSKDVDFDDYDGLWGTAEYLIAKHDYYRDELANIFNNLSDYENTIDITIGRDDSRMHFDRNDGYYIGDGIAKDGSREKMKDDTLGTYSNFGITMSDFRYHPELIIRIFALAGLSVKLPILGWKGYRTPEIDLYKYVISSDYVYLGKHVDTDGVFDMTKFKTLSGTTVENKLYTAMPPLITPINWGNVSIRGKYEEFLLHLKPYEVNNTRGNKIYYTTNESFTNPNLDDPVDPVCGEENGTKYYADYNTKLWPTFKNDLYNIKYVKIKAIVCNDLFNLKTNVFNYNSIENHFDSALYIDNNYHKPYILDKNIDEIDDGYIVFDIDDSNEYNWFSAKINFRNGESGVFHIKNTSIGSGNYHTNDLYKKDEYIKYLITNNKNDLLTCDNGEYYNGERFVLQNPGAGEIAVFAPEIEFIPSKAGVVNKSSNIKIIKCAIRDDNSIFQSDVVSYSVGVTSSSARSDFKDGLADIDHAKDVVDNMPVIIDGGFGGFDKVGGGFDPKIGDDYLLKNKGADKDYGSAGIHTMGYTGSGPNIKLNSTDEYVNEKLDEINNCFKTKYNGHLDNINKTIDNFTQTRDKSREESVKSKYNKAISKLQEIKEIFINRYKFIKNYERLINN